MANFKKRTEGLAPRIGGPAPRNLGVGGFTLRIGGFTLVELIIVTAIILSFSSIMLAQYGTYLEQSKLKSEVQKFVDILDLAKKKSSSKEILAVCPNNLTGYRVLLNASQYELSYCCNDDCDTTSLHTYQFPAGISIISGAGSASQPDYPVTFTASTQGTTLSSDIDIYMKNTQISAVNKCIHVNVTKIGGIVNQDSQLTSCP